MEKTLDKIVALAKSRGELAFAVCRLPVSADLDRSLVLSEKEYFTVSRYRYKHY